MGALSLRRVVWVLGIAAVAGASFYALRVYSEGRDRKRLRRVRHISQVFHGLPIDNRPAPFEKSPEILARAAMRRLLDPNVSLSAVDTAARTLRKLAEEFDVDWRSACGPDDTARAGTLVAGGRGWDASDEGFAAALDVAVGDWTRSAGVDEHEVRGAALLGGRGGAPGPRHDAASYASQREKGPERCRIAAVDAATGAPIEATVVHLLGPPENGRRPSRAVGTGPAFRSEAVPADGDTLVVWAEGHEAAELGWKDAAEVEARLEPAAEFATVSLSPEDREAVTAPLTPFAHLSLRRDGTDLVLAYAQTTVPVDGAARFPVPQGGSLALDFAHACDEVVVPVHVVLRPGTSATVRLLPRTDVRLEAPAGATPDAAALVLAVPDALAPLPLSEAEFQAWHRFLGPFSGPIGVTDDDSGWTAVAVPRIPFLAWTATADGRRLHFRVAPGDSHARPDGGHPLPLVGRPVVDGVPVPDGTVLVPGRLDWSTARALAARPCRAAGISHFVHAGSDFARTALAATETLTAVHPERGVAWLRFDGRSVPSGSWEKGEIAVSSADGGPLRARIELRSGWDVGQGNVWTTGVEPRGHVDPGGASSVVLRGLPCADYVVRFDLVERAEDGTPSTSPLASERVTISPERLRADVVEPRRR